MKLYNVITVFDVYAVAESEEEARLAVLGAIRAADEPLDVSESTALESREDKNVRTAWRDQRPLVGNDVSDDDFAKLKGKTTSEAHAMLYKKAEPKK